MIYILHAVAAGAIFCFCNTNPSQRCCKASKHKPKASAFCKPKTSTATTRGQKAHLALGAHHIFCNTSIVFRVFFIKNEAYGQRAKKNFFCPLLRRSGLLVVAGKKKVFLARRSINDHFHLA